MHNLQPPASMHTTPWAGNWEEHIFHTLCTAVGSSAGKRSQSIPRPGALQLATYCVNAHHPISRRWEQPDCVNAHHYHQAPHGCRLQHRKRSQYMAALASSTSSGEPQKPMAVACPQLRQRSLWCFGTAYVAKSGDTWPGAAPWGPGAFSVTIHGLGPRLGTWELALKLVLHPSYHTDLSSDNFQ